MSEESKPKYYKVGHSKYTAKYAKTHQHQTQLRYMNWQYDKIVKGAEITGTTVTQFMRQAIAEKLEQMGIDINDKGEIKDEN